MIDVTFILLADLRDGDHLPLVGARRNGASEQRLHALGVRDGGRQSAGNVVRHVTAADRYVIGIDEISVEEHPDRGCSPAHVDNGHAERDFVLDKTREPGGIRADDQGVDFEMRVPNCRSVISDAGRTGGHHVHVDAEPLA